MVNTISTGDSIIEHQTALAHLITSMHYAEKPELEVRFGKMGREKTLQDALYHLVYLAESIRADSGVIFNSYLEWLRIVLEARNVPPEVLVDNLKYVEKACTQLLSDEKSELIKTYIESGIESLKGGKSHPATYLTDDNPLLIHAKHYLSFLIDGKRKEAQTLINELIRNNYSIPTIYEHVFKATQYEVGLLWQTNKITVAHEHYCTAATQLIMSSLYASVFETKKKGAKLVACAISGDLHEIGIRMISDLFELDGWDTYYLGSNMPDINVLSALKEQDADILAISVTIPFHLSKAEKLIKQIRNDKAFDKLKIIVGGYIFNIEPALWKQVGADGYAQNGHEAVLLANNLIKKPV
jgi:methanogenic corrinoid protein MtbC1